MIFNRHSQFEGMHAPFSPSQSAWLRYSEEEVIDKAFVQPFRVTIGTEIHDFAADQIILHNKIGSIKAMVNAISDHIYCKYKYMPNGDTEFAKTIISKLMYLPSEVYDSVKMYVNDAISYRMSPEQVLYFSDYFYGTTDAISFSDNYLRIHDLKTGSRPAHMEQLLVYAALFCLEYKINPEDIDIECRIYQLGEIENYIPTNEDINDICNKIIEFNDIIKEESGNEL